MIICTAQMSVQKFMATQPIAFLSLRTKMDSQLAVPRVTSLAWQNDNDFLGSLKKICQVCKYTIQTQNDTNNDYINVAN